MVCTIGMALNACTGQSDGKDLDKEGISVVLLDNDQEDVSTMLLKKQKFYHELISNGKVAARKIAELRFETNEIVAKVYVKNGDRVQKGQKLAELDKFKLQNSLKQAEIALERAKLDLQDVFGSIFTHHAALLSASVWGQRRRSRPAGPFYRRGR